MSTSRRNLWPEDIAVTDAVAPVTLLKEQASLLGQRTKNLVEAQVTPGRSSYAKYPFCYLFQLVAPVLDNYRYHLFTISHGVEFYPVRIDSESSNDEVNSEAELMLHLANLFSSERTKGIISSLIAQSKA